MRKILIALLCFVSCSAFAQRITDKLERVGFLELRANGPLHLPEDTVLSTSVNADICQQIAKKNGVVYTYDCFMEYWRPIAPENTLDSARRSNDTLYFRTFAGTEFAVMMDYYDKGQADARYKPIGYVPAWVEITDKPATFPPSAHQHPISEVTGLQTELDSKIPVAEKAAANGVATLGSNGKIPSNQIPALAISETFVVASQASMLGLTAETGDVAVRTDLSKSFILSAEPPSTLSNWQELLTPTAPVQSVNGQTGNVVITKTDVGLGNVDNTSDLNKPVSTATQIALNGKEPTIAGGLPTQYWTGSKAWADFTQSARDAFSAGSGINITNGVITNTAPAPATPTLQQVADAGNASNTFIRIIGSNGPGGAGPGIEMYQASNEAWLQGFNRTTSQYMPLNLAGSSINAVNNGGRIILEMGRETGLNAISSGNGTFSTWQPLAMLSGGLLVSNRGGSRPPDDGASALQINGTTKSLNFVAKNANGLQLINSAGYIEAYDDAVTQRSGYLQWEHGVQSTWANDGAYPLTLSTNGSARMTVTGNGNVGIGTGNPISKLDVVGTIRTGGASSSLAFDDRTSGNPSGWQLYADLGNAYLFDNSTSNNRITVQSSTGNMALGAYPFNRLSLPNGHYIGWNKVDGTNDNAGIKANENDDLVFYSGGERMQIQSSTGNVGIGVTNPTANLHVAGDVSFTNGYFTVAGLGQTNIAGTLDVGGTITSSTGIYLPGAASFTKTDGAAAGKVLTSDAIGNASWQYPASGNYVNLNASDFTGPQTGYVYVTGNIRTQAQVNSAGIISTNGISSTTANNAQISITNSTAGVSAGIFVGTGSPENVVNAQPGSLFLSSTGTLYLKTSGTGNTGWVAK